MRIITAKYTGKCCDCGTDIFPGKPIGVVQRKRYCCSACAESRDASQYYELEEDDQTERDWPPSPSVLASDRRLGRRGLTVVRFSSGAVMTQNSRGRCIDAPCCGCCS